MTVECDEAGNLWARLAGEPMPALASGSHLDSVPGGGWLDGALGVLPLGVCDGAADRRSVRRLPSRLVDWADEEGARFGRSLLRLGASPATSTSRRCATCATATASGSRMVG